MISGGWYYILATAASRPSPYFWLFYVPQPPLVPAVARAALRVHLTGQFFVYAFVGMHVLGAAWHVVIRRDATLDRMLPTQNTRTATGFDAEPGRQHDRLRDQLPARGIEHLRRALRSRPT